METKNGHTIFQACFFIYLAYTAYSNLTRSEQKQFQLQLESVFILLLDNAAMNLDSDDFKSVLEKPDRLGRTVAYETSKFSEKLLSKLCDYNISMNQITANFEVIELNYPNIMSKMIKLGVNTRIINLFGIRQHQNLTENYSSNKKLMRQSLSNTKSIFFSIDDELCDENCSNQCNSALKRYVIQDGIFLDPFRTNRIGSGSSGSVFEGKWHSTQAAFKFIPIRYYKSSSETIKSFFDLQENISEFFHQQSTRGQNVLRPIGFYRQQIQKGKTKFYHFDVIVYPLCDCNLYQLLKNVTFSDNEIENILDQCLRRKEKN